MANDFKKEFSFEGDLYCDKDRAAYKALGCNRGLKYIISSNALSAYKGAKNAGYQGGSMQGDALQLGGVFLISRKEGILFQHLEEYAGHHVNLEELTVACQQSSKVEK